MNLRRLAFSLIILAAGLGLFVLYVNRNGQQRQQTIVPPAAAQAIQPASQAVAPSAGAATTTAASPVAARAEATAPATSQPATGISGEKWFGTRANTEYATIGSLDPNEFLLQLQLSSDGSGIYTAKLSDFFVTVADKRLYRGDPARYEQRRTADPGKYRGHYSLLNPVPQPDGWLLPLATRGVRIEIEGDPASAVTLDNLDNKAWVLEEATKDFARFSYTFYRGADRESGRPIVKLTKTYAVRKGDYTVSVSLKAENLCDKSVKISLDQLGPTGVPNEDPREDKRSAVYGHLDTKDQKIQVVQKPAKELMSMALGAPVEVGRSDVVPPTVWIGQTERYFGAMMYLTPPAPGRLYAPEWKAEFYVAGKQESATSRAFATGVKIPDVILPPGQGGREVRFELFAGPKNRELFSNPDYPGFREIYKQLNFLGTIDFGGCCTWAPLTLGMMWLLNALAVVAFGNYGVAIILLVFLVRIVLHPLTKKGQVSMMKMQKLAPQMKKLQEKYADDKNALNKEMMAMYKQQGATPILGFLPMFLQMPIWVALFTALNVAVELRHAGFLPVWITDLSGPDALFTWSAAQSQPLIGHTFNLLPILLTVAMYFQTKMTPQMGSVSASPDQQKQQKMMQYMMPVMMLFFFYTAPSGLTLYIMASTAAGVIEQIVIRRHIQAKEAEAAARETTVAMPGRTFRAVRPKKPRGPFWTKRG